MITLKWVKAAIECEGCGKPFSVFLDPGDLDDGMDIHDLAVEAVRNGDKSADDGSGHTSLQSGLPLCRACTKIADEIDTPGDREPTRAELETALESALAKGI